MNIKGNIQNIQKEFQMRKYYFHPCMGEREIETPVVQFKLFMLYITIVI